MRKLIDSRHPVDNMLHDVHIYQEASFMVSEVSFILHCIMEKGNVCGGVRPWDFCILPSFFATWCAEYGHAKVYGIIYIVYVCCFHNSNFKREDTTDGR